MKTYYCTISKVLLSTIKLAIFQKIWYYVVISAITTAYFKRAHSFRTEFECGFLILKHVLCPVYYIRSVC